MRKQRYPLASTLTALGAALALQGAVLVAAPAAVAAAETKAASAASPEQARTGQHHHMRHHRGRHHQIKAAMWVPGYGPIGKETLSSLSLNEEQQNLLEEAKAAGTDFRKTRREAIKTAARTRAEQLKSGKLDPRQAVDAAADQQERALAARKGLNEKWLALWDALSPEQQGKVTAAFQQRAEKHAEKQAKWREKRESRKAAEQSAAS